MDTGDVLFEILNVSSSPLPSEDTDRSIPTSDDVLYGLELR